MKKISVLLIILIAVFSCKTDKKEENKKTEIMQEVVTPKIEEKKYNFKEVESLFENQNLKTLTDLEHSFEEDIVFEGVYALKKDENLYDFVFVVNKELTNMEKLSEWKIAMMFFAKEPSGFELDSDRKRGFKTAGLLAKPLLMGKDIVIVHEDFKIKTKELNLLRIYLYNNNNKMNKNYYNTNEIVLP